MSQAQAAGFPRFQPNKISAATSRDFQAGK